MSRLRKWWRPAALVVAIVIVSQVGVSLLVRTHRVHAYLVRHLERAFGRPVEVARFSVLLLPRPSLSAEEITVGEDPAFGNEYFLRAEHLSAGLRWMGFLRGRFEFGTLSLSRPSLNLVRNQEGRWNLERWLPPAKINVPGGLPAVYNVARALGTPANHLTRIDIDDGRVNFKIIDEKLPFALTSVAGVVEQVAPGRWQLQLEAAPWRSGVALQTRGNGVCPRGCGRDFGAVAAGGVSSALVGRVTRRFVAIVSRARLRDSRRVRAGCDGEERDWSGGVGFGTLR